MSRGPEKLIYHEIGGLLLLGVSSLFFLALVSYDAADLPTGFFLSSGTMVNTTASNAVGRVGALGAALGLFLLGAATYLAVAVAFGVGALKLLKPRSRVRPRLFWIFLFIVCGAAIAQVQPWFLQDWPTLIRIRPGGAGGEVGYWVGTRFFRVFFGPAGSLLLLLALYGVSLLKMIGVSPLRVVRRGVETLHATTAWLRQALAPLPVAENVPAGVEPAAPRAERRRNGRAAAKAAAPAENGEPAPEFDFNRPPPQVIDTTAPTPRKSRPAPREEPLEPLVINEAEPMESYQVPDLELLDEPDLSERAAIDPEEMIRLQEMLIETLGQFGILVAPGDITRGPTITRYEVYPAKGVRVDKIVSLERDLARATCAERINILAPIPGKDTVGIEIANSVKQKVMLRELLESEDWGSTRAKIPLVLGKDVYGRTILGDLAAMPHLLVAGTTGSGKSVCINSIIASIIYRFKPDELQFIMIDPKVVEMQVYNTLPHLAVPVVTDPKKVLQALRWVIEEMEKRYKIFARVGVRNITGFNARPKPKTQKELDEEKAREPEEAGAGEQRAPWDEPAEETPGEEEPLPPPIRVRRDDEIEIPEKEMPYIVVIIDELADLMQTAPADVESAIARITQMARAAGIHMIVATQTPRADVITGVIKANIPTRIAFQVASALDSRIILDEKGAERLLGQGDMLYVPPGTSRMTRAQGVFVTDEEIRRVVEASARQRKGRPSFNPEIEERLSGTDDAEEISEEDEELVQKCIEIMKQERKASTSLFQRRLRLGYTRAARVVDILEQRRYVAAGDGAKPREILVDLDTLI